MEEKLKILEGMDTYLPSIDGVITCMHNYCLTLNEVADVVAMAPKAKKNYVDNQPYKIVRCKSTYLPIIRTYYGAPSTDAKFLKEIMSQDFDIVHFHSPFNMAKFAIKVAKKKNIPVVATFHTNFRSIFQDIFKSKAITEGIIKTLGSIYNKCDEVFVCSESVAQQCRSFGYTGKISILPYGSDYKLCPDPTPLIRRANLRFNIRQDELVFIFTGRLMPLKRIDFIIDALKICKDKGLNFKFFVAGKGVAMDSLKKQAKELGLQREIKFLGFVEQDDLDALYARANLLLFPSLYDNFGLVKVESAAFWTAGLYIRDSQAGDGVTDGVNGFLSEDSVQAYAEKIITATSDIQRLTQIGKNASEQLYISWHDCTLRLHDRLREIVAEHRGKTPVCNQKKSERRAELKENHTPAEVREINKRARKIEKLRKKEQQELIDRFYN